jgi:hypothetical protein
MSQHLTRNALCKSFVNSTLHPSILLVPFHSPCLHAPIQEMDNVSSIIYLPSGPKDDECSHKSLCGENNLAQGDPLSMFGYRISILPLIRKFKLGFPAVKQPWYANDAGAGGCFSDIRKFFLQLQEIGPAYGYFPEPTKSILIVRAHNRTISRSTFNDLKFKVQAGSRYLGGYIGSQADRELWVQEKVSFWTSAVTDLAFATLSHPQTAFAGLQKSLQHEWQFIQWVIDNIGDCFFDIK